MTSASAPGESQAGFARGRWWPALGVVAFLLAVAATVEAPYLSLPHVYDDHTIQLVVGLTLTEKIDWFSFVLPPFNLHWVPLFKLTYLLETKLFGVAPRPWHLFTLINQSGSAAALFFLARRSWNGFLGPMVAATLWAGAAIGHWDNPLCWFAVQCLPVATAAMLVAMIGAANWSTSPRSSASLIIAVVTIGGLYFGPYLVYVVAIALIAWRETPLGQRRAALMAIAAPTILLAIAQAGFLLAAIHRKPSLATGSPPVAIFERTFSLFGVALANLAAPWPVGDRWPPFAYLISASVVGAVLIVAWRRNLALVLPIFVSTLLYLLAIGVSRSQQTVAETISSGRYLYAPTLFWCVTLGAAVSLLERRASRQTLTTFLVVGSLIGYVAVQRHAAESTSAKFYAIHGATDIEPFGRQLARLRSIARSDRVYPDIPLDVPPLRNAYFPLSVLAANTGRIGPPLHFVSLHDASPEELRLFGDSSLERPTELDEWARTARAATPLIDRLHWLIAVARQDRRTIRLPDGDVVMAPLTIRLSDWLKFGGFSRQGIVSVAPAKEISAKEEDDALAWLRSKTGPEAADWRRYLQEARLGRGVIRLQSVGSASTR